MLLQQKISVNFWFDTQAEEAVKFYILIFNDSKINRITHYGKAGHDIHKMDAGTVMTVEFELEGQKFVALNGGPVFQFNEAMSLVIGCDTQEQIDYYWDKLSADGDPKSQQCGWLKDKFGVSWQVVPNRLSEMFADEDSKRTGPLMRAMLKMHKLDLAALEKAYEGGRK